MITASWQVLFKYAKSEGDARLAYKDFPTEENKKLLDIAIKEHNKYQEICLKADKMIGLGL